MINVGIINRNGRIMASGSSKKILAYETFDKCKKKSKTSRTHRLPPLSERQRNQSQRTQKSLKKTNMVSSDALLDTIAMLKNKINN